MDITLATAAVYARLRLQLRERHAATPAPLFQTPPGTIVGNMAADGKRFLLVTPVGPSASAPLTVVLNWMEELKQSVPPR